MRCTSHDDTLSALWTMSFQRRGRRVRKGGIPVDCTTPNHATSSPNAAARDIPRVLLNDLP
jgi:hypothetical protein